MARIRTVKPELFRHEDLYELELDTGLPIRLCFIALFTCCDRDGRFKWKPRQLQLDCIPYDDVDFSRVLDALASRGFVIKYAKDKRIYGCIPTFLQHQVINNRERSSDIPCYKECICQIVDNIEVLTREPRVTDASSTPLEKDEGEQGREGNKEGKGKEDNTGDKSPNKKFIPPTVEEVKAYCIERGNSVNPEAFVDHYEVSNWYRGKNKIKDWKACVRTWEKNQQPAQATATPKQKELPRVGQ